MKKLFTKNNSGATLIEYSLIAAAFCVIVIVGVVYAGGGYQAVFQKIADAVNGAGS